jgi:hypothetical protein
MKEMATSAAGHIEGEKLEAKRLKANKRKRERYIEELEKMATRYPIRFRHNARIRPDQLGTLLAYSKDDGSRANSAI